MSDSVTGHDDHPHVVYPTGRRDCLEHVQLEAVDAFRKQAADDLQQARDLVAEWAEYATPYFQEKWNLAGDLADLDAKIAKLRT